MMRARGAKMQPLRMAQYGTKHGHAAGKLLAIQQNANVELAGVFEPDLERRRSLEKSDTPFRAARWFDNEAEMLADPAIVAVASEGQNNESLAHTEAIVRAGKHVWYDKPAGDDWEQWQRVVALAEEKERIIQMGYMFRYHNGFRQISEWVKAGLLGDIFGVRAHMSTWITEEQRQVISVHRGGIFYDLAGHILDQIVWLLGRPRKISSFLRHDDKPAPGFEDNALVVLEYDKAMAMVDIAAMETPPMARRFEVYGSRGSAIMEPFEPARQIRLCLAEAQAGYKQGEQFVPVQAQTRQELYDRELESFLKVITGQHLPERELAHELLVQETLLRAVGLMD